MAVRVVEAEAMVDIDRGDVEADVRAGGHPVGESDQKNCPPVTFTTVRPAVAARRVRQVEQRDPDHEHAEHEKSASQRLRSQ